MYLSHGARMLSTTDINKQSQLQKLILKGAEKPQVSITLIEVPTFQIFPRKSLSKPEPESVKSNDAFPFSSMESKFGISKTNLNFRCILQTWIHVKLPEEFTLTWLHGRGWMKQKQS